MHHCGGCSLSCHTVAFSESLIVIPLGARHLTESIHKAPGQTKSGPEHVTYPSAPQRPQSILFVLDQADLEASLQPLNHDVDAHHRPQHLVNVIRRCIRHLPWRIAPRLLGISQPVEHIEDLFGVFNSASHAVRMNRHIVPSRNDFAMLMLGRVPR